jgi:hypothetical protein
LSLGPGRRLPKLVRVRLADGRASGVEDLASGFQRPHGERWARPVGLVFGPDGALYGAGGGIEGWSGLRWLGPDWG